MKSIILKIKHRINKYTNIVKRFAISLHKRDMHLIVYGGALDLFIDNAKHLFIINNQQLTQYRHVWLTRNYEVLKRIQELGFEAVNSDTLEGKKLLYRAGMVIYDNRIDEFATHNLSSGAIRFNLWHGIPGKKIGHIKNDPPISYEVKSLFEYKYIMSHTYGDNVLATSTNYIPTMSAAFEIPKENVIVSDQPRNRFFYMSNVQLELYINQYESIESRTLYYVLKSETRSKVIYMPTFRDADPQYIYRAIPDWEMFNSFLKEHNIIFYLKVHRVTPLPQKLDYSNIKILDKGLDIYPLLPLFDKLITDYSSIMFDFALLHKPIIIYDYDLEEYVAESRYVFKSFRCLLKDLTEVKNYNELISIMAAANSSIKQLPLQYYYDCPEDLTNIAKFIISKLK